MIDAHFHIWRQADLPWLMGPMQPRIFGPYEPIRRDYPIEEYLADAMSVGMTEAVYVQANWPVYRSIAEAAFVAEASDRSGFPIAIVAYADMLAEDARPQLDALAANPRVRGVRMQLHWHENPLYRFASAPDLALSPVLQRNVARLADYGWSFDLQVFAGQMPGACTLADA
jgi:predicted TIM-barrel fold metal-dependent hydrolase